MRPRNVCMPSPLALGFAQLQVMRIAQIGPHWSKDSFCKASTPKPKTQNLTLIPRTQKPEPLAAAAVAWISWAWETSCARRSPVVACNAPSCIPRGSIYTTIGELIIGPKMPYYRRNFGSQLPNGCIRGPSGLALHSRSRALRYL